MTESEKTPNNVCAGCGRTNDMRTQMGEIEFKRAVQPGHVSICYSCGHIAIFTEDLSLREPTSDEMHDIAGQPDIIRIQKARARVRAQQLRDEKRRLR